MRLIPLHGLSSLGHVSSAMVGMARCAVPARVVAGGTNIRATLAFGGVAPLHAARTAQRAVPTALNTGSRRGRRGGARNSPLSNSLPARSSRDERGQLLVTSNRLFGFGQHLLFAALNCLCFIAAQGAEVHFTVRDSDTGKQQVLT